MASTLSDRCATRAAGPFAPLAAFAGNSYEAYKTSRDILSAAGGKKKEIKEDFCSPASIKKAANFRCSLS